MEQFRKRQHKSLLIPFSYLTGRQTTQEFPRKKQKNIKKSFEKYGLEVLNRDPILVCEIPTTQGSLLVILDDHNRARFSQIYHINPLPCYVYSLESVAEIFGKSVQDTRQELRSQVNETRDSFSRRMGGGFFRGFGHPVTKELEHEIVPYHDVIGRFSSFTGK